MPKEPISERGRRWQFTLNSVNGVLPEMKLQLSPDLLYFCYQIEQGEQGTKHYQGCIRLSTPMRLNSVKALLGFETIHLEIARQWDKLILYCKKSETRLEGPWEAGDAAAKKTASDKKDAISAALMRGETTMKQIALQTPGQIVTHGTGYMRLLTFKGSPIYKRLKVFLLLGSTGRGKSLSIRKIFPEAYILADNKNPWADGYCDQRELVIEEFGPGMMNINTMKRLLDKYAVSLPVKGGFVNGTYDTVIITSNNPICTWYREASEVDMEALTRRIELHYFNTDDDRDNAIRAMLSWRYQRDLPDELPKEAQKIIDIVDRLAEEQTRGRMQPSINEEAVAAEPVAPSHPLSDPNPPHVGGSFLDLDDVLDLDMQEFDYIC